MDMGERAQRFLAQAHGADARFRDGQLDAIRAAATQGARSLVVQRTGWGKSVVYFIATRILRESGSGTTLIVSPLLSLMRNQIQAAARYGVRAAMLTGANKEEWPAVEAECADGGLDLLMVSPERLGNARFCDAVLPKLESSCGLLVIDEAHCISDWGHDFRPDYRRILATVRRLHPQASVLATTATANDRVIADVSAQLGGDVTVVRGPLMRESLHLRVFTLADQAERLAFLAKYVPRFQGSGIVYALTVNDSNRIAEWLRAHGVDAWAYHADLSNDERVALEDRFAQNEVKAICATTALGMGYDKDDVGFIVHFQRPGSVISYYQQIGRAGRNLARADVVLLEGAEDDSINEYFIQSAFPGREVFDAVKASIVSGHGRTVDSIVAGTNATRSQVERALKLLEVEGAVVWDKSGFRISDPRWEYDRLRSGQIQGQRTRELEQMREYALTDQCRMSFLASALDDPSPTACGKCDRCKRLSPATVPLELTLEAMKFLKRNAHTIESKAFFPAGFESEGRKKIPDTDRLAPGLALSIYGDAGWGKLVQQGKYVLMDYPDDLVTASVDCLRAAHIEAAWITWVPSLRHPRLVASFAERLAASLGVPALECVIKKVHNKEQKEMHNSTTQLGNAWDAFAVDPQKVLPGPCLLVDDIVDSGWTLTAVGIHLRRSGCQQVIPFALASARPRDDK